MYRKMNLHLFDDSQAAGGAAGGNTGNSGSNGGGQGGTGAYTHAQVEELVAARTERAERAALTAFFQRQGMSEEEANEALKKFKEDREKNKPNVPALEKERDDALKELRDIKNANLLRDKGIKPDDLEYALFKIEKMVDDKTDFPKAAEKFLKENPRLASSGAGAYRVSTSTATDANGTGGDLNGSINNAIRRAARN